MDTNDKSIIDDSLIDESKENDFVKTEITNENTELNSKNEDEKTAIEEAAENFKKEDFKYEAFISYRHIEPDATAAEQIHKMIETFKMPIEFYVDGKKPNFRVFRDREELTATYLSKSLDDALHSSKYLIVICSKRLKDSIWCMKEVETFSKIRGLDYIIPVLIEGEPSDSYPKLLLEGDEKLAADLRPIEVQSKEFKGYASIEKEDPNKLKELTKKTVDLLKVEKYRIMAAILGVSYGDLKQRDKERKNKALLRASLVAMTLLMFFGAFMVNAYRKENLAKKDVMQKNSKLIMGNAEQQLLKGNRVLALMYSKKAMEGIDKNFPTYNELSMRRVGVLNDAANVNSTAIMNNIDTKVSGSNAIYLPTINKVATAIGHGEIGLWDPDTGSMFDKTIKLHKETVTSLTLNQDRKLMASGSQDNNVAIIDTTTLKEIGKLKLDGSILISIFSPDNKSLFVLSNKAPRLELRKFNLETMEESTEKFNDVPANIIDFANHPTENKILITFSSVDPTKRILEYDMDGMKVVKSVAIPQGEEVYSSKYSSDGKYIYLLSNKGLARKSISDGKVEKALLLDSSFFHEGSVMKVNKSRKEMIFSDLSNIYVVDEKTWSIKNKYLTTGEIINYNMANDGTIITTTKEGAITVIKNGAIVDKKLDYGEGIAELVSFSDNSKFAFFKSYTNHQLKIAKLRNSNDDFIMGNLLRGFNNGRYALIQRKDEMAVIDTENKKDVYVSKDLALQKSIDFITLSNAYNYGVLSNDGSRYVRFLQLISEDKRIENKISIFDFKLNKEITSITLGKLKPVFINIADNNKEIVVAYQTGEVVFYDIESSKELRNVKVNPGFMNNIILNGENKMAVVYQNISLIYDFTKSKDFDRVQGQIVKFNNDGYIAIDGRNIVSKTKDGISTKTVDERIDKVDGVMEKDSVDLLFFHEKSNRLLSVINRKDESKGFLIDINTGTIEKTYNLPVQLIGNNYGFVSSNGKSIFFKGNSYSNEVSNKNYSATFTTLTYPILSLDELLNLEKNIIKNRSLSKEELQTIGQ